MDRKNLFYPESDIWLRCENIFMSRHERSTVFQVRLSRLSRQGGALWAEMQCLIASFPYTPCKVSNIEKEFKHKINTMDWGVDPLTRTENMMRSQAADITVACEGT